MLNRYFCIKHIEERRVCSANYICSFDLYCEVFYSRSYSRFETILHVN